MYEREILETYKECKIKSFPVNCVQAFKQLGYRVSTYDAVAKGDRLIFAEFMETSSDGFVIPGKSVVLINNRQFRKRQIFTLAHELGHIVMVTKDEDVADTFASNFLAPRPIIFARQLKTADDIASTFGISISAANNALILRRYEPDNDDFAIIDYFGERERCPWPFNLNMFQENDVPSEEFTSYNDILYRHIPRNPRRMDEINKRIVEIRKEICNNELTDNWEKRFDALVHEQRELEFELNMLRKVN